MTALNEGPARDPRARGLPPTCSKPGALRQRGCADSRSGRDALREDRAPSARHTERSFCCYALFRLALVLRVVFFLRLAFFFAVRSLPAPLAPRALSISTPRIFHAFGSNP